MFRSKMELLDNQIVEKLKEVLSEKVPNSALIFLGYRGSISHNTYIPPNDSNGIDDIDLVGVYFAQPEYYIGMEDYPNLTRPAIEIKETIADKYYDCVFYEFRHFMKMLLNGNPNIIPTVWVEPEHLIVVEGGFEEIINSRKNFLGKHAIKSAFTGYAHRCALDAENVSTESYKGYMGEKRKALVDKYGYDVKNASHAVRLLVMCNEALQTSEFKIYRTDDSDLFVSIKQGKWSLPEVKNLIRYYMAEIEKSYLGSPLPDAPDKKLASDIMLRMLKTHLLK